MLAGGLPSRQTFFFWALTVHLIPKAMDDRWVHDDEHSNVEVLSSYTHLVCTRCREVSYKGVKDYAKNDFWGPLSSMALCEHLSMKSLLWQCKCWSTNFLHYRQAEMYVSVQPVNTALLNVSNILYAKVSKKSCSKLVLHWALPRHPMPFGMGRWGSAQCLTQVK